MEKRICPKDGESVICKLVAGGLGEPHLYCSRATYFNRGFRCMKDNRKYLCEFPLSLSS